MILSFVLTLASMVDLSGLDAAIDRCDRAVVQPILADEMRRRSQFATVAYLEQSAIVTERAALVARRQALRQQSARDEKQARAEAAQQQMELDLATAMLDARQQALEDQRRLEFLRREAIDLKRQYYLTRCPSSR